MAGRHQRISDTRLGVLGSIVLAVAVLLALSGDAISPLLADRTLHAVFAEAGGLVAGDEVMVSGMAVGRVTDVELRDTDVRVDFTVDEPQLRLGRNSAATIAARSVLGKKALQLTPLGPGQLVDGEEIPLSRTTPPYDVTAALQDLTSQVSEVDTAQLATAMNTVSDAFSGTAQSVPGALTGLRRLSESVNARDTELRSLLEHSRQTTELLARHDQDLRAVFAQGTVLLSALNERQAALERLLANLTATANQLDALAKDNNAQLGPALDEVRGVLTTLRTNRDNLANALHNAVPLLRSLGEVMSSMPALDAFFANIPPTNAVPGLPQLLGDGRPPR